MGRVHIVSGPAGVGKNELIKRVLSSEIGSDLIYIPSATTRSPREGEYEGNPYHFMSLSTFMKKNSNGDFIESEEVHGNWYGTDKLKYQTALFNGGTVLKDIDVNGALRFKETFQSFTNLIYIAPPSMAELERRLYGRGSGDEEENKLRLSRAQMENSLSVHFDHRVVNDDLDSAVDQLISIIKDEGRIWLNPEEVRFTQTIRQINMGKLKEIIESIRTHGYDKSKPIETVRSQDGTTYVSDGHHRVLACQLLSVKIPSWCTRSRWIPFNGLDVVQYDYEDLAVNMRKSMD